VKPTYAHNALAKVVVDGKEIKIIRDNMPFGRAAEKEFGTYFIGYARSPRTIEQMLENMFVVSLLATTIVCSISALPKPAICSSCRPRLSWKISRTTIRLRDFRTSRPFQRQSGRRNARVRSALVRLRESLPHE